ncbi:hypothetical protein [Bosea sp. MMO-172]
MLVVGLSELVERAIPISRRPHSALCNITPVELALKPMLEKQDA